MPSKRRSAGAQQKVLIECRVAPPGAQAFLVSVRHRFHRELRQTVAGFATGFLHLRWDRQRKSLARQSFTSLSRSIPATFILAR